MAATVFRPGGARRAFPCFDEPHLRAPFRISVFRDRFHIGLSNSIVIATEDVGFYMGIGLVSLKKKLLNFIISNLIVLQSASLIYELYAQFELKLDCPIFLMSSKMCVSV